MSKVVLLQERQREHAFFFSRLLGCTGDYVGETMPPTAIYVDWRGGEGGERSTGQRSSASKHGTEDAGYN
jgi:hypothetical protein